MDTHNLDGCYAKRVDVYTEGILGFDSIRNMKEYEGIDLFAIRPSAKCIPLLLKTPLLLGRATWDNFWADAIGHKLPYNICYHIPHDAEWTGESGEEGNEKNMLAIEEFSTPDCLGVEHYDAYFKDVK